MKINKLLSKEINEHNEYYGLLENRYEALVNDYVWALKLSSSLLPVESSYEVLKEEHGKITTEHIALQATHNELESFHEKLVESYVTLDVAHEVVMT